MTKARDIASAAPAPSTVSATELGYVDGVTSAIQTQLDAKTAKSTLTTTGDIYYASAANTPARLGIGTASQLLAVNSGATAPEWVAAPSSGGMTLISTTTLTGSIITLSSIPATYNDLQIVIRNYRPSADNYMRIRMNSDSTANRHCDVGGQSSAPFDSTAFYVGGTNQDGGAASQALFVLDVLNYANTTTWKMLSGLAIENTGATPTNVGGNNSLFAYNQTAAISSIQLFPDGGTFTSGTVLLYGVK